MKCSVLEKSSCPVKGKSQGAAAVCHKAEWWTGFVRSDAPEWGGSNWTKAEIYDNRTAGWEILTAVSRPWINEPVGGGLKAVTKMEFFKGKCWTLASLWEYRKETGGKILRGEERVSKVCIIYLLRYGFVSNPCRARSGSTGRSQPGCSRRSSSTSILEAEHKEQAAGFAAEMTDRKKTDQYSKAKGKASKQTSKWKCQDWLHN